MVELIIRVMMALARVRYEPPLPGLLDPPTEASRRRLGF